MGWVCKVPPASVNVIHNGLLLRCSPYFTLPCHNPSNPTQYSISAWCGGVDGLSLGEIVTKAKPKVGQWWESAYVHGRGPPPEVSCCCCCCWWMVVGHARQKPTWPRPTPTTLEPPGHRPLHPSAGCLRAVRVRLIQGRSIAPGGGSALLPAAAAPAFSAFLAGATPLLLLSRLQHASLQL